MLDGIEFIFHGIRRRVKGTYAQSRCFSMCYFRYQCFYYVVVDSCGDFTFVKIIALWIHESLVGKLRFPDKQLGDFDLTQFDNVSNLKLLEKKIGEEKNDQNAMETILDATKSEENPLLPTQSGYY